MFEKYSHLVDEVLKRMGVPRYIEADCRQAGYLGLLLCLDALSKAEDPESYAFISIKNEILKELAKSHGIGHLPISLKTNTFLAYGRYKSGKTENVSNQNQAAFEKLRKAKRSSAHNTILENFSR